jgi:hypothetical protein
MLFLFQCFSSRATYCDADRERNSIPDGEHMLLENGKITPVLNQDNMKT